MRKLSRNRPPFLRELFRDLVVVVLAETLVPALTWCFSRYGKVWFSRFTHRDRGDDGNRPLDL